MIGSFVTKAFAVNKFSSLICICKLLVNNGFVQTSVRIVCLFDDSCINAKFKPVLGFLVSVKL